MRHFGQLFHVWLCSASQRSTSRRRVPVEVIRTGAPPSFEGKFLRSLRARSSGAKSATGVSSSIRLCRSAPLASGASAKTNCKERCSQLRGQRLGRALDNGEHAASGAVQNCLQENCRHRRRQRGANPDRQSGSGLGLSFKRHQQIAAKGEDRAGIVHHGLTGRSDLKAAPAALQQLAAKLLFQSMDLRTHRRLSKTQPCAGPSYRALARDGEKVKQMMVVQPIHVWMNVTSSLPRPKLDLDVAQRYAYRGCGGSGSFRREENLEARGGIEPPLEVLQTSALPLGDRASLRCEMCATSSMLS